MIIYNADGVQIADVVASDSSYRKRELKGEHKIYLDFVSPEPIDIPLGSYIEYDGKRYVLENHPLLTKQNSRNIEYKAEFCAPSTLLQRYKFRNTIDGRLKFSLTAKPHEQVQMLVDNLNLRDSGWTIGEVIEGNEKVVTYDYTSCAEALNAIAEAFETDWEIDDRTIHLRKVEYNVEDPLPLSYGKGNGFVSGVARQNRTDEDSGIEILYVCGGEQNVVPEQNTGGFPYTPTDTTQPVRPKPLKGNIVVDRYPEFNGGWVSTGGTTGGGTEPTNPGGGSTGGGGGNTGGGSGTGGGGVNPERPGGGTGVINPVTPGGNETLGGGGNNTFSAPRAAMGGDTPTADSEEDSGIMPMDYATDAPPITEPDPSTLNAAGNSQLILPRMQTLEYKGETYATDGQGYYVYKYRKPLLTKKEGALQCDDIYPKRVGTISEVIVEDKDKNFYYITDTSIPDTLDYKACMIDGTTMTVIFQDGMLAGKEFDADYNHKTRTFKIVPQEIDGVMMPNDAFAPTVGGKYIVVNIKMPDAYVCDNATQTGASWDLFRKAAEYLHDHSEYLFTFTGTLDGIWAKQNWDNIGGKVKLGGTVLFSDTQFQPQGVKIRIVSIQDYINDPHRPELELSNDAVGQSFATEIRMAASHQAIIATENNRNTRQYAKRRFNDAVATAQMLVNAGLSGFDKSISPITVQTMQMLVGAKECQFRFVTSTGDGQQTDTNVTQYWDSTNNQMICDGGILQHQTLGVEVVSSAHKASEYYHWALPDYVSARLDDSEGRYVYARCVKPSNGTRVGVGEFILSDKSLPFEDTVVGVSVYNLLVGILNPEIDGSRSYAPMYGFSLIEPGRMVVDRLQSSDFDPATKTGACLDLGGSTKRLILGENAEIITDSLTIKPHDNGTPYSLIDKVGNAERDAQAAQQAAADAAKELNDYKTAVLGDMNALQAQIDGQIESWFLSVDPTTSNAPASAWNTDEEKEKHLNDTYTNTATGRSWRWTKYGITYSWVEIADTATAKALKIAGEAQTTANGKRRVFTSTPNPPYEVGDLWAQGIGGDLMRCIVPRAAGSYTASEWEKASRYTDDTAVNDLQLGATNIIRFADSLSASGCNEALGRGSGFMNLGGDLSPSRGGNGDNYGIFIDMPSSRQEIDGITDPIRKARYEKIWAQIQSACGKFLTFSFDYECRNVICSTQAAFLETFLVFVGNDGITYTYNISSATSNTKFPVKSSNPSFGCRIPNTPNLSFTGSGRVWYTVDLRLAKEIKYFLADATKPNGYQKYFYVVGKNDGNKTCSGYLKAGRVAIYVSAKDLGWSENPDVAEEYALRDAKWRNEIGIDPNGLIYWNKFGRNEMQSVPIGINLGQSMSGLSIAGLTRNEAVLFNGSTNYVKTNVNLRKHLSNGMTISAWVYATLNNPYRGVAGNGVNNAENISFVVMRDNNNIEFGLKISSGCIYIKSYYLPLNVWNHAVMTACRISATTMRMYVYLNGVYMGYYDYTGNVITETSGLAHDYLFIGTKNLGTNDTWFSGALQDVMVWNRPLSDDEVKQLYKGNYLEKVIHQGSTEVKGGLVLSQVLGVKNKDNELTGMISGLTGENDKVRMFFADSATNIDTEANRNYNDNSMPSKIKFLIDKNGGVMMNNVLIRGNSLLFGTIMPVNVDIDSSNYNQYYKGVDIDLSFILTQRLNLNIKYKVPTSLKFVLPGVFNNVVRGENNPEFFVGCQFKISNYTNSYFNVSYIGTAVGSTTISSRLHSIYNNSEAYFICEIAKGQYTGSNGSTIYCKQVYWKLLYDGNIFTYNGNTYWPKPSGGTNLPLQVIG